MTSEFPYDIEHVKQPPTVPMGWFMEHVGESIHPRVASATDIWMVFTDSDDPIAMALVDDSHSNGPELARIGVDESHRREGVASELVRVLLDEYGELRAETREDNEVAQAFYEANGWVQTSVRVGEPDLYVYEQQRPE